jgi:hypothetical protein
MENKTFDVLSKQLRQERRVPSGDLPAAVQAALLKLAAKEFWEQLPKPHRISA